MTYALSRAALLLALLTPLQSCAFFTYTAEPIEAWVVDAETNQPLEGVIVVAHWQLKGGLEGGNPVGQMMVLETVTDAKGRFYFPGWGPKRRPLNGELKTDSPGILLFKSGYAHRGLDNGGMRKTAKGALYSEWHGKTVKMERFKGTDIQAQHKNLLNFSKEVDSFATWYTDPCQWTHIPIAVNTIMQERKKFEAQGITDAWSRTLDQRLLDGEQYFVKDCGIAAQHFFKRLKK